MFFIINIWIYLKMTVMLIVRKYFHVLIPGKLYYQ